MSRNNNGTIVAIIMVTFVAITAVVIVTAKIAYALTMYAWEVRKAIIANKK